MKKIFLLCLLAGALFADKVEYKKDHTFIDDLMSEVETTLDSNITQKLKLENIKDYVANLKFDDNVDKSKYKFNVMGHYENYMLLGSYTHDTLIEKHYNTDGTPNPDLDYERDTNEAQFQLSIKVPLYANFLGTNADLFSAYTQNSYWQVYDTEHSSPFRETNYMPELFLEWSPDKTFGDSTLKTVRFALIHQSNGQDLGKSRSWNRTEMFFLFKKQNLLYGFNVWDRWNEDQKTSTDETEGDDNPGLEEYVGNQKFFVKYKSDNFNIMIAHQNDILKYDINKGNTKVDITFPSLNKNLDFFIRCFSGYGESLIDYNVKIRRVSFGIMIADWL